MAMCVQNTRIHGILRAYSRVSQTGLARALWVAAHCTAAAHVILILWTQLSPDAICMMSTPSSRNIYHPHSKVCLTQAPLGNIYNCHLLTVQNSLRYIQ